MTQKLIQEKQTKKSWKLFFISMYVSQCFQTLRFVTSAAADVKSDELLELFMAYVGRTEFSVVKQLEFDSKENYDLQTAMQTETSKSHGGHLAESDF